MSSKKGVPPLSSLPLLMTQITQAWLFTFFYRQTEQQHSAHTLDSVAKFLKSKNTSPEPENATFSEKNTKQNHPKVFYKIFIAFLCYSIFAILEFLAWILKINLFTRSFRKRKKTHPKNFPHHPNPEKHNFGVKTPYLATIHTHRHTKTQRFPAIGKALCIMFCTRGPDYTDTYML